MSISLIKINWYDLNLSVSYYSQQNLLELSSLDTVGRFNELLVISPWYHLKSCCEHKHMVECLFLNKTSAYFFCTLATIVSLILTPVFSTIYCVLILANVTSATVKYRISLFNVRHFFLQAFISFMVVFTFLLPKTSDIFSNIFVMYLFYIILKIFLKKWVDTRKQCEQWQHLVLNCHHNIIKNTTSTSNDF